MNCETCQELIHDLIDGSITERDEFTLNTHLKECLDCHSVRQDLASIVGFCRTQRGQYEAPPNEQALWLRIRNVIEAELPNRVVSNTESKPSFLGRLMGRTWELSLPQLVASTVAIVLLVSLSTVVGLRRFGGSGMPPNPPQVEAANINERIFQRQQVIDYWKQRIELNKAHWSAENRAKFERSLRSLDEAIQISMDELTRNPHDDISYEMLNISLDSKLTLLKDYSDL
jgi:putative zinc finger protein